MDQDLCLKKFKWFIMLILNLRIFPFELAPSISTGSSLALTASLMQFTHLGDGEGKGPQPSEGPKATGTLFLRSYQYEEAQMKHLQ